MAYEWESKTDPATVSPGDVAGRLKYWADEYDRLAAVVISLHNVYSADVYSDELRHARFMRNEAAARTVGNVRGVLAELNRQREIASTYLFS